MDEKLCYMTLFVKLLISQLSTMTAGEPCERGEFLASGRALKNHIFKSVVVRSALDCHFLCKNDKKCNSYNFMITGNICELSNSTKEARPHDFLHDEAGLYMGIRPVAGNSQKNKQRVFGGIIISLILVMKLFQPNLTQFEYVEYTSTFCKRF